MYFLFSIITILPLFLFMSGPAAYTWAPWISLVIACFGGFILIPKRRILFTIPLLIPLIALLAMLFLVEMQWLQIALIVLMGLMAWHWWRLVERTDTMKDFQSTMLLYTLVFLFCASYAGNALIIYIDEPLWKVLIVFFSLSVLQFFSLFRILFESRWLLPSCILSLITIELFLALFYLPVAFSIKSIALALFTFFVLDLALRHRQQQLTIGYTRFVLMTYLIIISALLATAEWV